MGFKKWLGGEDENAESAYVEYTLATLRPGYLVDYDLKTWQVGGYGTYDYDGYITEEWELSAEGTVYFLERSEEDGINHWTFTRAIDLGEVSGDIQGAVSATGDPPETLEYGGRSYEGTESAAGLYKKGGEGPGREFVSWSYEADDGELLFVSQWGEREFSAYAGSMVEEYQFTDILPAGES